MDLRTETTPVEIELAPGSHIKYLCYLYTDPQPRTSNGSIPIGVDENGGQIFHYGGKAMATVIEAAIRS